MAVATGVSEAEDQRDGALLARHREGDPAAFAELYAHHRDRLVRLVRTWVPDWREAGRFGMDPEQDLRDARQLAEDVARCPTCDLS